MNGSKALYPMPAGLKPIAADLLDMRPDADIDKLITHPPPVSGEKNIWFFWDSGYNNIHPYARRNVQAWHRRLAPLGWTIRVIDFTPGSPSHISNFLDTSNRKLFPKAFHEGTITWTWKGQMLSDLVRFPLLLTHGGIYADVTTMQIGDIDQLWNTTIGNPDSKFEVLMYNYAETTGPQIPFNYLLASRPGNAYFLRAHRLLLELWGRDGGRKDPVGMIQDPLLKHAPALKFPTDVQYIRDHPEALSEENIFMMADYAVQMMVLGTVLGTVDEEDGWNGPQYSLEHIFALHYAEHAQLAEFMTSYSGIRQYTLLSLKLPVDGVEESEEQAEARKMVEAILTRSFGMKLTHGPICKIFGDTLGLYWRRNDGADNGPGTYAHWLRYAMTHWTQEKLPERMAIEPFEPLKVGPLLRAE